MDSQTTCEVEAVLFDGHLEAARDCKIATSVVGATFQTTLNYGEYGYDHTYGSIHLTHDGTLYMFENAVISSSSGQFMEEWMDVKITASKRKPLRKI